MIGTGTFPNSEHGPLDEFFTFTYRRAAPIGSALRQFMRLKVSTR